MLDDLGSTDAIFDRGISDMLSGTFLNDLEVKACYLKNFAPYYQHSNEYWTTSGPENALGKEVFAQMFRIYTDPDRMDSKRFIEKYYPNTSEQFKKLLSI